jgi:acyl-[acyl carrier protein]--UDP-N-acetylglucosamine O-acyltransferase
MSTWTPVTLKDNPTAHIRTDVIPFVLTTAERDVAIVAGLQLEANRRRQNEREAMRGLAQWKGEQYRVGEAL